MLREAKGNMYSWVTHTWNTVKGECPHGCAYCYMKRWGKQKPVRFDESELKTELNSTSWFMRQNNFIFVGSSCDMFAENIPDEWIKKTLKHMEKFDSKYLLQTKNPQRVLDFIDACVITDKCIVCTTIESDSFYPEIMKNSPQPMQRSIAMQELSEIIDTYVTIEPILEFNLEHMVTMIKRCSPKQVNIGFNTSFKIKLPEPSEIKTIELIHELRRFTKVVLKSNSKRIIKDNSLYL